MSAPPPTSLRRALGLAEVTFAGLGTILGAGIYALLGAAAGLAGNAVWMAFVISAFMAILTGLSYAELASIFPSAAAEHEYVSHAMGRRIAFVIGWLSIVASILAVSAVSLGFAGYFVSLTGLTAIPSASLLILPLGFLLFYGIKETALFAVIATFVEAGGVVFVILIGLPHFGDVDLLEMPKGLGGLFQASSLVFFAYTGFEGIVKLAEETKSPEKTIPRALLLSIAISIALYVLVSISAVSVVGWQSLAASPAPFAEVAGQVLGERVFVAISIIALFATSNTSLMFLLAASRITYGMANSRSLPAIFARVHPRTRTPWVAVLVMTLLSILFLFAGDLAFVAHAMNFTVFLIFIMVNATLVVLRIREPDRKRPFRVPLSLGKIPILPVTAILFSLFLLVQIPPGAMLLGLALALLGLFVSFFLKGSST